MIHVFNHHAMATLFQVRLSGEEADYAEQAAHAAFEVADRFERLMSRFQMESEVSQIARLGPGEGFRLSEPLFACLEVAREMETITRGAFSVTAAAPGPARWSLDRASFSICCEEGGVAMDLGAIGKGFALDRMAGVLREWSCPSFLLIAGGSSILAGEPPEGLPGWDSGLGEDHATQRLSLARTSLSGSGVAVKGRHILDPRTGQPAQLRDRAWVVAPSAAVSDALSTACMVLEESEVAAMMQNQTDWRVYFHDQGQWRSYGANPVSP